MLVHTLAATRVWGRSHLISKRGRNGTDQKAERGEEGRSRQQREWSNAVAATMEDWEK